LSTHILPEVAQTCQKVVIINKGKIVAIDTPDALTERLHGAQTLFVEAHGPAEAIQGALRSLPGVVNVSVSEARDGSPGAEALAKAAFQVDSEKGLDVRREVAAAIVRGGWGLLELRPMRLSLEEIFLSLTTEENTEPTPPTENTEGTVNA
jgi:ABC-2 type transport system ATP-binding protein